MPRSQLVPPVAVNALMWSMSGVACAAVVTDVSG